MLMSTAASFGAEFGFAKVSEVKQVNNGFFAYTAGGEAVGISAYQYTQMKDADGYYILSVDGKKIVAAGDEFEVQPLTVDSVGIEEGGKPKVFFTNGTAKVFKKADWLKALKGQTVRRAYLNIPTWEWENFATVDKGDVVIYHDKVAPAKAPVAEAVAKAPVAEVKAPVAESKAPVAEVKAPVAEAPAIGIGKITFSVK